MTEGNDRIDDGVGTYDVVLLVEQALGRQDAEQVWSLHDEIADEVVYHVVVPVEDAAQRIEAAMGSVATGEVMAPPSVMMQDVDIEAVRRECHEGAENDLTASLRALRSVGATAHGRCVEGDPIDALAGVVGGTNAREAIILTRSHVVKEFFHVDWTSRARRRIGVPVLHLLEHESFDEQAGGGEGVTGL